MIVDAFLNLIRGAMHGDGFVYPTHIGIGTGFTGATASDTALETEVYPYGGSRGIISSKTIITSKEIVFQLSLLPAQGNGNALREVAILNAATGGTMTNRIVHPVINKTTSFELIYQITVAVSDV